MTDRKTVERALRDAIDWRMGLVDAYAHMPEDPEYTSNLEQVRKYRALLKKRYGYDTAPVEQALDAGPYVDVHTLVSRHQADDL